MGTLTRALRAAFDEINKPDTYVKGDEFESYVRSCLFPKEKYIILQKTHDYVANKNDYIESSMEPDFKFKSGASGKDFYVEAKYRSEFRQGAIEWCKPYQLKRYQNIDNNIPTFVVIGVGGNSSSPEHLFLAPVKHIKYTKLFSSFLREYRIPTGRCVDESKLSSF